MTHVQRRAFPGIPPGEPSLDLSGDLPVFTPAPAVLEALARSDSDLTELRVEAIRRRLADRYRLNERNVLLLPDLDAALASLVAGTSGPLVHFPPDGLGSLMRGRGEGRGVIEVARGFGRDSSLTLDVASDLPHDCLAVVASPSDPLGTLLSANDAVRLARSCQVLVIDERRAEYAAQSIVSLASEFANVIVLRSFRPWLGHTEREPGWALCSPRTARLLETVDTAWSPVVVQAVLAAQRNDAAVRGILARVREERSRLYRSLRKLSFLQPLPSWGPYVAARVEVGEREMLLTELARRGVRVHAPAEAGLEQYVRIGIGTPASMDALRRTLLDIAPAMLGEQLACRSRGPYGLALRGEELGQSQIGEIEERGQRTA